MAEIRMTLKSPDALSEASLAAANEAIAHMPEEEQDFVYNLGNPGRHQVINDLKNDFYTFATEWVKYGEYVVVEFDTIIRTCRVLKADEF